MSAGRAVVRSQSKMAQRPEPRPRIPRFKVLLIAGTVPADIATVQKVIAGQPVRGGVRDRVRAEIKRQGYALPADEEDDE